MYKCVENMLFFGRYLNSTVGNIILISKFRKKSEEIEYTAEEEIFSFWMDYFVEATKTEIDDSIRFPVSRTIKIYYDEITIIKQIFFNL